MCVARARRCVANYPRARDAILGRASNVGRVGAENFCDAAFGRIRHSEIEKINKISECR